MHIDCVGYERRLPLGPTEKVGKLESNGSVRAGRDVGVTIEGEGSGDIRPEDADDMVLGLGGAAKPKFDKALDACSEGRAWKPNCE